ncbi:MAG: hypothetical protein LC799_28320 [Actinobacteria bacterium]|nr:hypothetical protein [Actinomycetota bacterium]
MKKLIMLAIAGALVTGLFGNAAHAGKTRLTVVGTDPSGDWGENVDPEISPIGDVLGQDLVGASIGMADAKTVAFVITVKSLPPIGGTPEVTRYGWDFNVDDNGVSLDGKFTNYSRGICDPNSGHCPPPRDPGTQPFFLRADCYTDDANQTYCKEKGIVHATFDAAKGTITIPVPLKLIGAKPGSEISPATVFFGGVTAIPSAYASNTLMPLDKLIPTKTFVVPR